METSIIAVIYTVGIGLEVALLFVKWRYLLSLPVVVSSIVFLCTRQSIWLFVSLIDLAIIVLGVCTQLIIDAIRGKKKLSLEEKLKIKDL